MNNNEFVALMTYASELFSWYKGSIDADVYFCPERHGTYFGGFYMNDYPAMNNPDYFISTATTGDSGKEFLNILNTEQRALITGIIDVQRPALTEIAQIRTAVSTELRKAMAGGTVDKVKGLFPDRALWRAGWAVVCTLRVALFGSQQDSNRYSEGGAHEAKKSERGASGRLPVFDTGSYAGNTEH